MSNSLHNKIHLVRHAAPGPRRLQRVLLVSVIVGVAGACLALGGFH